MKQTRRTLLRQVAGGVAGGAAWRAKGAAQSSPDPKESAAMKNIAEAFMTAHSVPGLSVGIARNGEIVYQQGFGFANVSRREEVRPSHLFRIASVTKPITSVTIFDLVEKGRLKLDELVFGPQGVLQNDFGGPPYKQGVEEIRVKHLLTHTGGGWPNDESDPMFRNPEMNHTQLIRWAIAEVRLTHAPGQHYAYSNFGYCVLGRVIEKVTRQPYERYVCESILSRCGIADMRISGNTLEERAPEEVVYYGQSPYSMNVRRMDSHGGWLATAPDLVRFAIHVDGFSTVPDILQERSISEMTTPTPANSGYAKGWAVNSAQNWWHAGSLPGTTSLMVRTSTGLCWAALANFRESDADTGAALDRCMWDIVRQVKNWHA